MNETKAALEEALIEFKRQRADFKRELEAFENEKATVQKLIATATPMVRINVGGEKMMTSRSTLTLIPGTLLSTMFSGKWEKDLIKDDEGSCFLDLDPTVGKCV